MSNNLPLYFRRKVTIEVENDGGDRIEVCLRYAPQAHNWEVFINGGILADGRESAFFWRMESAMDFALAEAATAEKS